MGSGSAMHRQRIITALIVLPVLVLIVLIGGILFHLLVASAAVIALWEFYRMTLPASPPVHRQPLAVIGFLAAAGVIVAGAVAADRLIPAVIALNFLGAGGIAVRRYPVDDDVLRTVFAQMVGVGYIPGLLVFLVFLRNGPDGAKWIFLILCLVFANDTGAFYAGRFFGRHKLWPAVSPGKTLEGAVGGMVATAGVGLGFCHLFLPRLPLVPMVVFFVIIGVVGPFGDLFESIIKRVHGIKDSGGILPGHGGLLDRIDALIFAAPVAYLFQHALTVWWVA